MMKEAAGSLSLPLFLFNKKNRPSLKKAAGYACQRFC